jgi:hypothetical protein
VKLNLSGGEPVCPPGSSLSLVIRKDGYLDPYALTHWKCQRDNHSSKAKKSGSFVDEEDQNVSFSRAAVRQRTRTLSSLHRLQKNPVFSHGFQASILD